MKEFEEHKNYFKREAQHFAKSAAKSKRNFTRCAIFGIAWSVIFVPFGIYQVALNPRIFEKICGLAILIMSFFVIRSVIDSFKSAKHFYNTFMGYRQQCLDELDNIKRFEDKYRGFKEE